MEKWKTKSIKDEAKEAVNKEGVQKIRIALFILIIPTIISVLIFGMLGFSIGAIVLELLEDLIMTALVLAIKDILYKGKATAKFQFNYTIFAAIIFYQFVSWIIYMVCNLIGLSGLLSIIPFILGIIWGIIYFPVQYLIAFKEMDFDKGLKVGLLMGYNYFWKILKLQLSFIPLYILCGITFGILFIFKASYIFTSFGVLVKRILSEVNVNMY